jgi:hypothetical protein
VTVNVPWFSVKDPGSSLIVDGHFEQLQIIPSSTLKPLVDAAALDVSNTIQ